MRPSQLIERYLALVEEEARFRRVQLIVLQEGQRSASDARRFIETYLLRELRDSSVTMTPQPATATVTATAATAAADMSTNTEEETVVLQGVSFELPTSALMNPNSAIPAFSSFLQHLSDVGRGGGERERGLTEAAIRAACEDREWSHATDAEDIPMCPISLQPFNEGDVVRRLRTCGHEFSAEAITTALRTSPLCPLCRGEVTRAIAEANV